MGTTELDEATKKWIKEQEDLMGVGEDLLKAAVDDALEYMTDAVENLNDRAWRKMTMSTQAVEMGIGVMIAEYVVPEIYNEMSKSMHKKIKVSKQTATALRHIFIGRVVKNVRKGLDARDK